MIMFWLRDVGNLHNPKKDIYTPCANLKSNRPMGFQDDAPERRLLVSKYEYE